MSSQALESIGEFADARRAARGAWLFERVMSTGSLVLRQIGGDRAGEVAVNRFLSSPEVSTAEIVATVGWRTGERCRGRRIVAAQDTTEINFSGRDLARRGLGPAGDGRTPGFFIHGMVAIDADEEAMIGLLDAQIWTRAETSGGLAPRRKRGLKDKESQRWLTAAQVAVQRAGEASMLILVGDRESDIYPVFARRPTGCELLIRAAQDRALEDGGELFAQAAQWRVLKRDKLKLVPRHPGEKPRKARISLRAGVVRIKRPQHGDRADPPYLDLTLVEAREDAPPPNTEPVHWRLLTTLPVKTGADAAEIVRFYRLRWRIEQVHRALKNDGFQLPQTQLHDADRLFKLAAIGIAAAVRTIQLVDARDGSTRPASDVADDTVLDAAEAIGPTLEGKTTRQKNPHRPRSLAWLAWIIARLGGWNCYYKPPGPKTMRAGWDRFAAMAAGFLIALPLRPT